MLVVALARSFPRLRPFASSTQNSDQQLLDGELGGLDLGLELGALVGCDGAGDDRPGDSARPAQGLLGGNEDVRYILVLGEEGQVKQDLQGLRVRGHDDELGDTAVQGLRGLVRALGVSSFSRERERKGKSRRSERVSKNLQARKCADAKGPRGVRLLPNPAAVVGFSFGVGVGARQPVRSLTFLSCL